MFGQQWLIDRDSKQRGDGMRGGTNVVQMVEMDESPYTGSCLGPPG